VQAANGPKDHLAWNSGRLSIKYLYCKQESERLVSALSRVFEGFRQPL
jgi:hypothetical protein